MSRETRTCAVAILSIQTVAMKTPATSRWKIVAVVSLNRATWGDPLKKFETERRESSRCHDEVGIAFSFLNTKKRYMGVARNYSRFGMYFETDRVLSPGTLIVIQPLTCEEDDSCGTESSRDMLAASERGDARSNFTACRQLKTLVVAQVKRCEKVHVAELECYGIGVNYVSPAV